MSNKQATIDKILERRVSAILRTNDTHLAADAMRAVVNAGFRMIEFTLTIPDAFDRIADFAKDDSLIVGAGTVLTTDDARRAVDAGAKFLVSPITDADVIAEANRLNVVSIPGTVTPTEMVTAHRMGADFLKFFPAQGDVANYVRSILGPLPHLRIFPTSGATVDNFLGILDAGAAGVGFVGSLFEPRFMAERDFTALENRAGRIQSALKDWRSA
ncbi:MAG: bifunctional 4-hydroxy-2-oxoglutarate aldolase/2-dehydro-3-deoxy-phosphogluconate aldolase [Phycisphaerales bacterium]|nr:bifunctional 4-hydroxy-2-oxoglutarate aldolase/2-dehydro-3-deoxy-phosphogluconate aldolase [Phycisphaerales bacterium]MCB9864514.1 bifunctional 4-hydroxy-2-oxoglutarate aldolase/2-dehydro-3-deoxy-phosphogluconate aldolase [Phycisphaerales bacterium]